MQPRLHLFGQLCILEHDPVGFEQLGVEAAQIGESSRHRVQVLVRLPNRSLEAHIFPGYVGGGDPGGRDLAAATGRHQRPPNRYSWRCAYAVDGKHDGCLTAARLNVVAPPADCCTSEG